MTTQLTKAQIDAIRVELAKVGLGVTVKRQAKGTSLKTWKPETQAGRACKAALARWAKCPPIQGVKDHKIRGWRHFWLDETHPKFSKALIYRLEMDRREKANHKGFHSGNH